VPAGELGLPHGRLTKTRHRVVLDSNGVSTLHMTQIRPGGTPSRPRNSGALLAGEWFRPALAASQRPVLHPAAASHRRDPYLTRHHRGFTLVRPIGLALACNTWMEQASLGFSLGLRTPRLLATHAKAGTGPEHWPEITAPVWDSSQTGPSHRIHCIHAPFRVAPTRNTRRRSYLSPSRRWQRPFRIHTNCRSASNTSSSTEYRNKKREFTGRLASRNLCKKVL
jgi:hypothetical protein